MNRRNARAGSRALLHIAVMSMYHHHQLHMSEVELRYSYAASVAKSAKQTLAS